MRLVRGFTLPLILLILVVGFIVGVVGNFQLFPKVILVPIPIIPLPSPSQELYDIENWNKYNLKGNLKGISFLYPPDWTLEEKERGIILKGARGQIEITDTNFGFGPPPDNLAERKDITISLKKGKLKGREFVYSSFTYLRNGLIIVGKDLKNEKCLCISASYEGIKDRGLILAILGNIEIKEE